MSVAESLVSVGHCAPTVLITGMTHIPQRNLSTNTHTRINLYQYWPNLSNLTSQIHIKSFSVLLHAELMCVKQLLMMQSHFMYVLQKAGKVFTFKTEVLTKTPAGG